MAGTSRAASITSATASAVVDGRRQSWRWPMTLPVIGAPVASVGAVFQTPFCLISRW